MMNKKKKGERKYMSENKREKRIARDKKRKREKGSESALADSTWTEAALYVCLQTITLHANRYHPIT